MVRRGVFCCIGGVAAVLVLLAFGVARSWPPEIQNFPAAPPGASPPAGSLRAGGLPPEALPPTEPGRFAQTNNAPPQPKAKTIDELIAALNAIQVKKVELERAEKETVTQLREALQAQKQQLQKLGVKLAENVEQGSERLEAPSVPRTSGPIASPPLKD